MSTAINTQNELAKLIASDSQSGDNFGGAVSICGKYAIVGAALEDTDGANAGAAYIYVQNDDLTWTEVSKLQVSDKLANDAFGCAVAISDKFAFVGAKRQDLGATDAGCVYVFELTDKGLWQKCQQLQGSDQLSKDYFGGAVAVSGDYLIVGAESEDANVANSGAAYIFEKQQDSNQWQEVNKLKGNAFMDRSFGGSVSISGSSAIVGASLTNSDYAISAGVCYIFERNDIGHWQQTQQLTANDKKTYDHFGSSVSIDGNFAIVGTKDEDNAFTDAGAAYIFERDVSGHWVEKIKLQASDKQENNFFGCSVDISGNLAVVGATGKDDFATNCGGAYLFKRHNGLWQEYQRLSVTDGQSSDQFGNAVAIDNDNAVVGMALSDSVGADSGAAYLFATDGIDSSELARAPLAKEIKIEKELTKLLADDGHVGDKFAGAVAMHGRYVIVGAADEDAGGSNAGAAYVFQQNNDSTLTQLIKLTASDKAADDAFGCAVAIGRKCAFVGAMSNYSKANKAGKAGSVYVYQRGFNGELIEQKLQASDGLAYDYFGCAISVSGDYAFIGATGTNVNSGAVYVFKRDGEGKWQEVKKLQGSDTNNNDRFGCAVCVSGSYAIIGAYLADGGTSYIFERNVAGEWEEVQQLRVDDKKGNDDLGFSVGIDGNYAIVGAKGQDNGFSDAGAVYIFERDAGQWRQKIKLQASDKRASDFFGWAVSISGDIAVVGAKGGDSSDGTTIDIGSAYLFQRDNGVWTERKQLLATDRQYNDQFGSAVAVSGRYAVIGSPLGDRVGRDNGSAYLFDTTVTDLGGSLLEGLLCRVGGGAINSGHTGDDLGSFVCDGTATGFIKLPGIRNMKSIAMWVNIKDDRPGDHYLLDARDSAEGEGLVDGYIYTNGVGPAWPTMYIDGTSIAYDRANWDNIPKHQWTHIYVEAEQNFNESINFMSNFWTGNVLAGNIDEIRIYDRALTSDEIKRLAES